MDISMPRMNGLEATRVIVREMPTAKVIALSMHEADDMAKAMKDAGAVAYLTKGSPMKATLAFIRSSFATGRT